MKAIDTREFRDALGTFATGVTIVTTLARSDTPDSEATPVAMTVNSFASVSLEPPLILWSIDRAALSFDHFIGAEYFAIHILHSEQQLLSTICATRNADKIAELKWRPGSVGGVPILEDYNTCFECKVENRIDGGDHIIILGRVCAFDNHQKDTHARPLIFYQGSYKTIS